MKHVTTSVNDYVSVKYSTTDNGNDLHSNDTLISATMTILNSTIKIDKRNFQKRCFGVFAQMAKNSSVMVKNFEKNNVLLERVDRQMDRLIE